MKISEQTYIVSWKSPTETKRKEAHFKTYDAAEEWYNEKQNENQKPTMFVEEIVTTFKKVK